MRTNRYTAAAQPAQRSANLHQLTGAPLGRPGDQVVAGSKSSSVELAVGAPVTKESAKKPSNKTGKRKR